MATSSAAETPENNKVCFLCCNSDSDGNAHSSSVSIKTEENGDTENSRSDQPLEEYSLSVICRYIKLNPNQQIFKDCENTAEESQLFKQFLTVYLCGKCGELVNQLTELCRELEIIKMKVDNKLLHFQTCLENNQPQECQNESQLVTSLRTRIKTNCENKLKHLLPRIELEACHYIQQIEDVDLDFSASEPVVMKIECDMHNNLDETPTSISAQGHLINEDVDTNLRASESEPIMMKIDCEELDIPESLDETPIPIRSPATISQNNPLQGLPHKRQCHLCGIWVHKSGVARHRTFFCKYKDPSNKELLAKQEKKHACNICHKLFSSPTRLRKHIRIVHPSASAVKTDEIKCEQCGRLISQKNFRRHLEQNCPNIKKVEHPATDPLGETELKRPLAKHDIRKIREECDQCGKMISKDEMSAHKKVSCKV